MKLPAALLVLLGVPLYAQPVELGQVRWERDLDGALETAGRDGKPVMLLFQEVPG